MATLTIERPHTSESQDERTLHRIQKGYVVWIGFLLFLYSALFFTLAFFGPHLQPLVTLYTGTSLADRHEAATELLYLSETVWVAVPVLFLGAAIFSLVLTRRVAGPLQVLECSIGQWAQGDLTARLRFRKVDRLDHLADSINGAMQAIETSFVAMTCEQSRAEAAVRNVRAALETQPGASQKVLQGLDEAQDALAKSARAAQRFQFSRQS
ncbi:MAG: HAMP domain-containing protein [Nitrospira sp. CR1.3]|nr:HAMP domain-containing protein [Nitrospira sp. CR1.3]